MQIKKNFLLIALLSAVFVPFASCFNIIYTVPQSRLATILQGATKDRSHSSLFSSLFSPSSRAISRFFDDDFFGQCAPMLPDPIPMDTSTTTRKISVGLVENEKDYHLKADLPGVKKEDLKVEIQDDRVLTISAEREESKQFSRKGADEKDETATSNEHVTITYFRSVMLPDDADANPERINAELIDGVLSIEISKAVKAPPTSRIIQIK